MRPALYAASEEIRAGLFPWRSRPAPLRLLVLAALGLGFGGLVAADARIGAFVTLSLVAPVLIWARPGVSFSLLCVGLGLNIDVLTTPAHVSLPQFLAMAMVAAVLIRPSDPTQRRRSGSRRRWVVFWGGAGFWLLAASVPSLPGAVSTASAVSGIVQLAGFGAVLWAAHRWLTRRPRLVDHIIGLLVFGGVVSLAVAVVQVVFNVGEPSFRAGGVMRAYSTYGQPNSYGLYLVGLAPLALVLPRHASLRVPAFVALMSGIILTGSRGAWIAAFIGMLTLLALLARLKLSTVLKGVAVASLLPLLLLVVPQELILSRFQFNDWSSQQRLVLLLTAWQGILQHPIAGWGPGAFEHVLHLIALPALKDDVTTPHNMILHVWFELGLFATVVFCVLVGGYYVKSLGAYLKTRDPRIAALIAGVTGMLTASMFGSLIVRGVAELFLILVAATGAIVLRTSERETPS